MLKILLLNSMLIVNHFFQYQESVSVVSKSDVEENEYIGVIAISNSCKKLLKHYLKKVGDSYYGLIAKDDWKLIDSVFKECGIIPYGEDYEFIYPELVAFAIGDLNYIEGCVERINRVGYTYLDSKELIEYSILDMAILSREKEVIEFLIEGILPRKVIMYYNYCNHFILIATYLRGNLLIEVSNYILKNLTIEQLRDLPSEFDENSMKGKKYDEILKLATEELNKRGGK